VICRRILFLFLAVPPLVALSPTMASEAEDGGLLYRVHCLACHGESGRGDGPMKDQLEMSIPDLTTIAHRNDGEFPTEKVHQIIDGRLESPAHGTRQMPVWGFTFQSTGRDTDHEEEVREMVSALTGYLETLQTKAEPRPEPDDRGD